MGWQKNMAVIQAHQANKLAQQQQEELQRFRQEQASRPSSPSQRVVEPGDEATDLLHEIQKMNATLELIAAHLGRLAERESRT